MPVRNDFQPGEFCWVDLAAHDLEAAAKWYGELFGWTTFQQETQGGPPYAFFMKGQAAASAVGQMSDEMKAQGIPPCWNSYVYVEDCAASEKRVVELGGSINVPTMEVPGHGKLCFFMDPAGTSMAMWQSTSTDSPGLHVNEHGGLSWNELMCRDIPQAREFYSSMFGWEFVEMPMEQVTYTMIKCNGKDAGGMMPMEGPQFEGIPNHWMVYFSVDDCEASSAKCASTGGKVMVPPTPIQVGTFSVVSDPKGGVFSIIQINK